MFASSAMNRYALKSAVDVWLVAQPALVGIFTAAACLASPGLVATHAAMFLLPFAVRRTPEQLGSGYLAAMLLSPNVHQVFSVGGVPGFDYSIQMSLSIGTLGASILTKRSSDRISTRNILPSLILPALLFLIAVRETSFTNWIRESFNVGFSFVLPVYLITLTLRSRRAVEMAIMTLGLVGSLLASIAIFESVRHWPLYATVDSQLGIQHLGIKIKMRGGFLRAYGPLADQTDLGFVLAVCLSAVLSMRQAFFRSRAGYLSIVVLILCGVLATQSRGALLGGIVAMILAPIALGGWRNGIKHISAIAAAMCAYGAATFINLINTAHSADADQTAEYRVKLLHRGIEEFWFSPLFGGHSADVLRRMADMRQGEGIVDFVNSYLYLALLTGACGLIIFIVFLTWPMIGAIRACFGEKRDYFHRELGAFCLGSFVAASTMYGFTSLVPRSTVLIVMVAAIATRLPKAGIIRLKKA